MTAQAQPTGAASARRVEELQASLRRLERRDWWLWGAAVLIMLLLSLAVFSLALPLLSSSHDVLGQTQLDVASHGLIGLVLLFSTFAIYQQILIKSLRKRLAGQVAVSTELHGRAELMEQLATVDPLTGLYNRRFAMERLQIELARAGRGQHPLTMIAVDINDFKQINDAYGHVAGDTALQEFSRCVRKAIRGCDLPVRMGGDEFLLVLPDCPADQTSAPLDRMRGCEAQIGEHKIAINFSAGWVQYRPGESLEQLLHRVDQQLYENKRRASSRENAKAASAEPPAG